MVGSRHQSQLWTRGEAIQFIQQESSQSNVKMLYLEVEQHNENAQKLYLAHDFEVHNRKILKHKL